MSNFQIVPLNEVETLSGQQLTDLNLAVLQNRTAELANQLINVNIDPNDIYKSIREQAFVQGQMAEIQYIAAKSHAVKQPPEDNGE